MWNTVKIHSIIKDSTMSDRDNIIAIVSSRENQLLTLKTSSKKMHVYNDCNVKSKPSFIIDLIESVYDAVIASNDLICSTNNILQSKILIYSKTQLISQKPLNLI